jgi:L-aminopeptidase/D-esterase-like protein
MNASQTSWRGSWNSSPGKQLPKKLQGFTTIERAAKHRRDTSALEEGKTRPAARRLARIAAGMTDRLVGGVALHIRLVYHCPHIKEASAMRRVLILGIVIALALSFGAFAQQAGIEPAKPANIVVKTGASDTITDVPGIQVGSYDKNMTGTTVILAPDGAVGGVDVRGSAPGSRESDLLRPTNLVDKVDAIVLTGGSAYGLATADGVMLWLEAKKRGWNVGGGNVVPIVPAAVLFDPGRFGRAFNDRPTAEFGRLACENASSAPVKMGNVGAGAGAISGGLKGGLGSSSIDLGDGVMVGAVVAVNSGGSTVNPATGEFYARYLEVNGEFGNPKRPFASLSETGTAIAQADPEPVKNTTIACIATNVKLTKAQAQKIAEMAHDGMARAVRPSHTMFDGDTVFVLGTGLLDLATLKQQAVWGNEAANVSKLGAAAADALARAIVRALVNAETVGTVASYRDRYPAAFSK